MSGTTKRLGGRGNGFCSTAALAGCFPGLDKLLRVTQPALPSSTPRKKLRGMGRVSRLATWATGRALEDAGLAGGVMHCFSETWEMARQALDLGFYISFSGIVTFKSAHELQTVARKMPIERMLIETDAPYLAPVPVRGKTNEPAFVRHIAEHLAKLRGLPLEDFAHATTDNFFRLFPRATR